MSAVLFFIAAIGAITGAVGVVMLRNPFYNVLALVGHLISLAALFLLLSAEFVAAAQVVVYAGAVMVLYVFVVAYIGGSDEPLHSPGGALKVLGPLFGLARRDRAVHRDARHGAEGDQQPGRPVRPRLRQRRAQIGKQFLTTYLFPFEIASLLLLVAAIGAVVLARRRRGLGDDDADPLLHPVRSAFTGTMAESRGPALRRRHQRRGRPPDRAARRRRQLASPRRGRLVMDIGWYLVVSAIIFCIGAIGVLVRPNPLVILLCLELMLNAANLALVAFSRMWGGQDGQVFALIVMVVAACEVTVGLGLIVAIYRRQMAVNVDELNELRG